ncbi:hypothetical protein [Mucilaginibacter psychrotolerans]|uniref:Uncharacterized protein n=1 Tax=Mucilaginibacter psychrotolerans TaxID=1524096 RepID=A0A4Y8S5A0_9SPHI|nr:hypothetical protein [Mucilaginibacter psychrotolerans]TFF33916.1 hypothetical protein E2R66_23855 [Mucilaginibacter psychrotolerans]
MQIFGSKPIVIGTRDYIRLVNISNEALNHVLASRVGLIALGDVAIIGGQSVKRPGNFAVPRPLLC